METRISLYYGILLSVIYVGGVGAEAKKIPCENICMSPCGIRTLFLPRSQGSNMARYLAGWREYLPTCDGKVWGNWTITTEYTRSRDGDRIAQYLFGSNQLHFSGSQVPDRNSCDLLADYFGLSTTFEGTIAFSPRIDNIILTTNYYLGLDQWCPGLYFRFNMPIVTTRWDLGIHCQEKNNITAPQVFPECYMSKDTTEAAPSIRDALSGNFVFGDMEQPFLFGKFPCGREQKTGVAELDFIVGYNVVADEASHAGLYLITVVPTGNKPESDIIFEPIVGNGRLWEIGPGISAHFDVIRSGLHILSFYINGYIAHQFKKIQKRSFDFIGRGPLSRYMLLKEFSLKDDAFEYNGSLVNAIDFATRAVRVGGSAKVDIAAKMTYYYDRWGIDLGYNLYAKTKEKLRLEPDLSPSDLNNRRFGFKGTEGVCYKILNTSSGDIVGKVPLNSVQQTARINRGGPVTNPKPIMLEDGEEPITWDSPTTPPLKLAQASDPLVFVSIDSLDILSAAVPHQLTHKFFAHVSYTAGDIPCEPQVGIGGEIESDGRSRLLGALNQWGVWFKFTISY